MELAGAKGELARLQQSVAAMMERYEYESTAALEVCHPGPPSALLCHTTPPDP